MLNEVVLRSIIERSGILFYTWTKWYFVLQLNVFTSKTRLLSNEPVRVSETVPLITDEREIGRFSDRW